MALITKLIVSLIWIVACLLVWLKFRNSRLVRLFLSPAATYIAIGLLLAMCLVIGFIGKKVLSASWIYAVAVFFIQTVLLFVLFRGWRNTAKDNGSIGRIRWRFISLHIGLLLTVISIFWSSLDSKTMRMHLWQGQPVREVILPEGRLVLLKYDVILKDIVCEVDESGQPLDPYAVMVAGGKEGIVKVNRPMCINLYEDIYIIRYEAAEYGAPDYCVAEIVYDPWKYLTVTGIILLSIGALLMFVSGPRKRQSDD